MKNFDLGVTYNEYLSLADEEQRGIIDRLNEQSQLINKELDKEKAKELYKQLYTELNNDLPYIFVYQRSDMWAYNGRVKGLENSPFVHYTWNLYKATLAE